MKIAYMLLLSLACALTACDGEKAKTTTAPEASTRADNPLLKLQDETVNKAKKEVEAGVQQTQQQLDNVDKQ